MEDIPSELVVNWDQTGISIVSGSSWTMTPSGSRRVEIVGMGDKSRVTQWRFFTTTINLYWKNSCVPAKWYHCSADWHIAHTKNNWANESTTKDYITKVIVPYIEKIAMYHLHSHPWSFSMFSKVRCASLPVTS